MLTSDTITDAQIRELRRDVLVDPATTSIQADDMCKLVGLALDDGKLPHRTIREARARCAEILNVAAAANGADSLILAPNDPLDPAEGQRRSIAFAKQIVELFPDGEHMATVLTALQYATAMILGDVGMPTSIFAERVEKSRAAMGGK